MVNKQKILLLCKIREEQYNNRFIDAGMEFLQWYSHNDTMCVDLMKALKSYWAWWLEQWNKRETAFMKVYENSRNANKCYCTWHTIHEPESVVAFPPKKIIEESWNVLMSDAWAEVAIFEQNKKNTACTK